MTLTEFLLARIAEDEAVSQAGSAGGWVAAKWPDPSLGWAVEAGMWLVADPQMDGDAHHIARHDPARVLAECDAKRRIVEVSSSPASCLLEDDPDDPVEWSAEVHLAASTLRALALPYADHPGFREEWRA